MLDYPFDALDRIWKTVLLQQFHDILPGSAIAWVHREAVANYAVVMKELEDLIDNAIGALACGDEAGRIHFNATPFVLEGVPALGAALSVRPESTVEVVTGGLDVVLDNGLLRVVVNAVGVITSIRDLTADREVVPPGSTANLLQLHQDLPNQWDAWDIDEFYRNTVTDLVDVQDMAVSTEHDGAVTVHIARAFGNSSLRQDITLRPGSRQVDFRVDVQWHERETLLKVAFPVDVHTDHAAYEIQFGHLTRPTHQNTSWDEARFEVCAHRWVHVGEPGYGVSVVNDSTYGHDVTRTAKCGGGSTSTVRLSLLRAPLYPDPETDQGRHTLRYALVAGAGIAEAAAAGYAINLPVRRAAGSDPVEPLVRVSGPGLAVIEAVKLADDRSGDVIVRLYEPLGATCLVGLTASFEIGAVVVTDLLERTVDPAGVFVTDGTVSGRPLSGEADSDGTSISVPRDSRLRLRLRPFQIVTLRLQRAVG